MFISFPATVFSGGGGAEDKATENINFLHCKSFNLALEQCNLCALAREEERRHVVVSAIIRSIGRRKSVLTCIEFVFFKK